MVEERRPAAENYIPVAHNTAVGQINRTVDLQRIS